MIELSAEERVLLGKKVKSLRQEGKIPGVLYGNKFTNMSLLFDLKNLLKVVEKAGKTNVVNLDIVRKDKKQEKESALIWNIKRNPVNNSIEHVDLYRVNPKEKVKVRIPLRLSGVSKGVKLGGKLEFYREYVDIIAYPQDLIPEVALDITELGANETIYLEQVSVPSTITKVYDRNVAVVSVTLNSSAE